MLLPFRERRPVWDATWGYTRSARFTPGFNICRLQRQESYSGFGTREEGLPTKDTKITKEIYFAPFVYFVGRLFLLRLGRRIFSPSNWPPAHAGGSDNWDARRRTAHERHEYHERGQIRAIRANSWQKSLSAIWDAGFFLADLAARLRRRFCQLGTQVPAALPQRSAVRLA